MSEVIKLTDVSLKLPVYGIQAGFRAEIKNFLKNKTKQLKRAGGNIDIDTKRNVFYVDALRNISLSCGDGERIGIIGGNGAGKSTLLKLLAGVYTPTSGTISVTKDILSLLNTMPGMNVEDTGYQNVMSSAHLKGVMPKQMDEFIERVHEISQIGEHFYMPVKTYSDGMVVRLMFAFTCSMDFTNKVVLIDEGIGMGDAEFKQTAQKIFESAMEKSGTMFMASHDEWLMRSMCNRAILMNKGNLIAVGDVDDIFKEYHASFA